MAASIRIMWPRLPEFSSSAGYTDHRTSKARGNSVMRPSVRIGNRCINVSKLTVAMGKHEQKVDGYRRGLCVITSAGSSDKLVPEESSDNIESKEVLSSQCSEPIIVPEEPSDGIQNAKASDELLKPQTVTSKITDVGVTSEFMDSENASTLLPRLDSSHETISKEAISFPMSSASSSFGPLRPPESRAMIEVINKLLKLHFNNLELAITKFDKCPKQDLYIAIVLTLLALTGRCFYFEFYEITRQILSDSNLR